MNSRLAMILALILLGGAVVAGYFAWVLSQPQEPAVTINEPEAGADEPDDAVNDPEQPAGFEVIFARDSIEAGSKISAEQLEVHLLPVQPPAVYTSPDVLAGKRAWRRIEKGEMIRPGHLREGSDLAAALLPTERAVAIAVDEVVGTGGFLAPGDSVDVLLYLRDAPKGGFPSAQVVLEEVRLLSFVERVQPPPDGAGSEDPERAEFRGKTAVLAVQSQDIARLMLASSAGTLRLALRSSADLHEAPGGDIRVADRSMTEVILPDRNDMAAAPIQLDALWPASTGAKPPSERPRPAPTQAKQTSPQKTAIMIHRGSSAEAIELPVER